MPRFRYKSLSQCMISRARSSAVEHYVDIVGVTGSIPVAPTTCKGGVRDNRRDERRDNGLEK